MDSEISSCPTTIHLITDMTFCLIGEKGWHVRCDSANGL